MHISVNAHTVVQELMRMKAVGCIINFRVISMHHFIKTEGPLQSVSFA